MPFDDIDHSELRSEPPCHIHWFKRDLRLQNNPALSLACSTSPILPVYIHDPEDNFLGSAQKWWLHHSLQQLNHALKGQLKLFVGNPLHILPELCSRYSARSISWNKDFPPPQQKIEHQIKQRLSQQGIQVKTCRANTLFDPDAIQTASGTPYKVFTPFARSARQQLLMATTPPQCATPQNITNRILDTRHLRSVDVSVSLASLKLLPPPAWHETFQPHWQPGENGACQRLDDFIAHAITAYDQQRDFPSLQGTSRLSPHLHFGEISPWTVYHRIQSILHLPGPAAFFNEILWREFSHYLLSHFPELPNKNFKKTFNGFPYQNLPDHLKRWQKGLTGYPIVDAGMRELWQTGTMHNRVRMIVASFLVKNCLIDWRKGADWFQDCLLDADTANNSANWQWVAGCGTDAAPYFRIFNPVTQGEKFDAEGEYTRHYVPELAHLPNRFLFKPWAAPSAILEQANITLGKNYPFPIIDLVFSRERALTAYHQTKERLS